MKHNNQGTSFGTSNIKKHIKKCRKKHDISIEKILLSTKTVSISQ